MRFVQIPDLGLLTALDLLLQEASVTAAAARMNRSVSAMSRTLGRIRRATGDPILVRAGRRLVLTARAEALRPQVRQLIEAADAVLRPDRVDLASLRRTLTIRANEGFISTFAAELTSLLHLEAPGLSLHFAPEGDEDVAALRDGRIDLDIGVIEDTGPEIKIQTLFRERLVGAVRLGHPLAKGRVTAKRIAGFPHVVASRRGRTRGPIDDALAALGLARVVALVVPSHAAAVFVAAGSDLVAAIPASLGRQRTIGRLAVKTFDLPFETKSMVISQAWHPRLDADPAHRWLRAQVRIVCGNAEAISSVAFAVSAEEARTQNGRPGRRM